MKIIISHDVDHITMWEHKKDLVVPKLVFRSFVEVIIRTISFGEYFLRLKSIAKNRYQNLEELIEFDKQNEVTSTFFIGVNNGLGLAYSLEDAEYWARQLIKKGFDAGVHGIEFDSFGEIQKEYEVFKRISGLDKFGIRMHYLRTSNDTLKFLSEAGYIFDSSLCKFENPCKIGGLWEFPLHIMDVHLFYNNSRWQNQSLEQAKDKTKRITEEADAEGIKYFTILFHDIYFSDGFKSWRDWYIWLINYLKKNGFEFMTYRGAIQQLEKEL